MIGVKSDSDSGVDVPDVIGVLAEEFIQQYRSGTNPNIETYCNKHPEFAGRIRDLFPMLLMVEACGGAANSEQAGSFDPAYSSLPMRIGDFKIIREIGRGGMGIVYEAEQQSLRRRVALKVLPPSATLSSSTIERFRRESRAAARLHHSNIVPVFGVGEDDGLHYYVMQFIQGISLDEVLIELSKSKHSQLLKMAPVAPTESFSSDVPSNRNNSSSHGSEDRSYWHRVAIIGFQLANALHFAHTQGVLHRDVKPANVLLDTGGQIWLTDFGLAHANDDANLTRSGDIVGTLRYLAPERLHGDGDRQSDVYGLGVTLYELLTLVPAFPDSDRVTLIRKIAHHEPKRLRSINPVIPRDLETIVLKAIEKEASRRYATAEALAEDLSRFLSDRPILARRVVLFEQAWRWCRRNPMVAILSSAVCLLMLGMSVAWGMVSWVQNDRDAAREAERVAIRSQLTARLAEESAMARSHLALAMGYRYSRDPGHKSKCLAEIEAALSYHPPKETIDELRSLAIATLAQIDVRPGRQWQIGKHDNSDVAYDRELSRFARMNRNGLITFHNTKDLAEIGRIELSSHDARRLMFSDQGGFLATFNEFGNGSLEIWNVDRAVRVIGPVDGQWELDFDDRQSKVVLWKADLDIHVYSLQTGAEIQKYPVESVPTSLELSPDGNQVAFVLEDDRTLVQVLDLQSAAIIHELNIEANVNACRWHPDGNQIACGLFSPPNLEIWDLATKKKNCTMVGHTQQVETPCFTKSGDFVSTTSWDGTLRVWETKTGQEVAVFTDGVISHPGHENVVAMRTYGSFIRSLELDLPVGFTRYANGNSSDVSRFTCGEASPNGRWLVAGTYDGLEVWDLVRGHRTASQSGGLVRSVRVDWQEREFQTAIEAAGYQKWPVDEVDGGWRVGTPRSLSQGNTSVSHCSITPDGSRCAIVNEYGEVRVLNRKGEQIRQLTVPEEQQLVELSPNGKLVVSFGWHADDSRVWEVDSGKLLHTLPGVQTFHSFSPDSKEMITSRFSDYTMRNVDDWKITRRIERRECVYPSFATYSPDGSMVALELNWGVIHLLRTDNFKTVAVLESPNRGRPSLFSFSRNRNTLFAFHVLSGEVHRWDLDGLRQGLKSMHLDWSDLGQEQSAHNSLSEFRALENSELEDTPTWIAFDSAAPKTDEQSLWKQKLLEAETQFASQPESPNAINRLAWRLVIGPSNFQDVGRALALMESLKESGKLDENSRNTLAVAYYRSGKHSQAIDMLKLNISVQEDADLAFDLYFLAMCYWKLGDQDRARETLEWSERMTKLKPPQSVELRGQLDGIRAEAKQLIQE